MPKNVMGPDQKAAFVALADHNPQFQGRMEGMNPLEYYDGLDAYDQNAISLLVHAAAFLHMEAEPGLERQLMSMQNDARRKGSSGERLFEISKNTAETMEQMRRQGLIGEWFYVPQAGDSDITYGLDAAGVDWIVEDVHGGGFKALQSGTNPRSMEKKRVELTQYYGKNMQEGNRILELFGTTDDTGKLLGSQELSANILGALSRAKALVKSR